MSGVMILVRSKMAASLLSDIVQADYLEGLGDDIQRLDATETGGTSIETKEIAKLYEFIEEFRAELLDKRRALAELLERQGTEAEADHAP